MDKSASDLCPLCLTVNPRSEWVCMGCGARLPWYGEAGGKERTVVRAPDPPIPPSPEPPAAISKPSIYPWLVVILGVALIGLPVSCMIAQMSPAPQPPARQSGPTPLPQTSPTSTVKPATK